MPFSVIPLPFYTRRKKEEEERKKEEKQTETEELAERVDEQ